eukprot:1323518-Amorphochlora_amoeboformis.AAC.1
MKNREQNERTRAIDMGERERGNTKKRERAMESERERGKRAGREREYESEREESERELKTESATQRVQRQERSTERNIEGTTRAHNIRITT